MPQEQQLRKRAQHASGQLGTDHLYAGSGAVQQEVREHDARKAVEGRCKVRSDDRNGHHHEKQQNETVPSAPQRPQDSSAQCGG